MSLTPREIGTLIVVILRANHLPNKRSIGKQDPYCVATVNGEKRRTKAIKRGGQHPEWDEEIRFTLFEDIEDLLARTARGDAIAPPPPPKDDKKTKKIKGGKTMKLACYADDPREPELIGETEVDLTEVLTKGETDDWFTLSNKDKFAGKVYIELTFWSNEPPPEKKVSHKAPKNKQYGGPGSFVPSGERPSTRIVSAASFPPSYPQQPHTALSRPPYGYEPNIPEATSPYPYDRPPSPSYPSDGYLENPYETNTNYPPSSRGPRHSFPMASSGFMLLSQPSGFIPSPSQTSEPSGFPPLSRTPVPINYSSQFHPQPQQVYTPPLSLTPIPANNAPYLRQSTSLSFHPQQPFSASQSFSYPPYSIPPSASAPPQQFLSSPPPASVVPQAHSAPPHMYPTTPSDDDPSWQLSQASRPLPQQPQVDDPSGQPPQPQNASRPLPQQPEVLYAQSALQTPNALPQPGGTNQLNSFSSTPVPNAIPLANNSFAPIPPPPPPILQYNPNAPNVTGTTSRLPVPPPPPVLFTQNRQPVRRASLPQPPTTTDYQWPIYQPAQPPPPPPPPLDFVTQNVLPPPPPPLNTNHPNATYYPVLPPNPPALVDEHGQWLQPTNTLSPSLQGF